MRQINEAIIHCSDSTWGTEKVIDEWHKEKGWESCGYHFVILNGKVSTTEYIDNLDGSICPSRKLSEIGSHCKGHNKHSIGICLIGKDEFTDEQFYSLNELILELKEMFPGLKVSPHNKYSNKTCPNFDVDEVINN